MTFSAEKLYTFSDNFAAIGILDKPFEGLVKEDFLIPHGEIELLIQAKKVILKFTERVYFVEPRAFFEGKFTKPIDSGNRMITSDFASRQVNSQIRRSMAVA